MVLALLFSLVVTLPHPGSDSIQTPSVDIQCARIGLDADSVIATFQTMDALLAAEQIYYERSSAVDTQKSYICATVNGEMTLQQIAQKLSCTLPPSLITGPDFYIVITYRRSDDYGDAPCRILDMCAYRHTSDYHLPIVHLTYCPASGARYYEYVTSRGAIHYSIE